VLLFAPSGESYGVTTGMAEITGSLPSAGWPSHLRADCLYTSISSWLNLGIGEYRKTLPLLSDRQHKKKWYISQLGR